MNPEDIANAFDTYSDQIYKYIYVRVNMVKEISEDLTQEVFIRAWDNRDKFDVNKATMKTWLYTIARNLVIDFYRKNGRKQTADSEEIIDIPDTKFPKTDIEIDFEFLLDIMYKKLNEFDCELIKLRYIEQFEIEEIAQIIDKNYNTTKVSLHRALQKLKLIANE